MILSIKPTPWCLLTLCSILISSGSFSQTTSRKEYILKYKILAINQMKQYGIPASITLAQGCLESGDGNSRLAREANNHFGIKCHDWSGEKILQDDEERNECFRKYATVEDSYQDHSLFLRNRERYGFLFSLPPTDYKGWAEGLSKAGYATNPSYSKQLIKIIEEFGLSEYDFYTDSIPASPPAVSLAGNQESNIKSTSEYNIIITREERTVNGVLCITANSRENYSDIAKEYSLFTKELLKFNDLRQESQITDGTIVYLERKKNVYHGQEVKHITQDGETMHQISQKYGIRLKSLIKLNPQFSQGKEPVSGDEIKLKKR
jgi:hypothetical protein